MLRVAHPIRPLLACALVLSLTSTSRAQDSDVGAWFAFIGQGHFEHPDPDARWRWWFDGHARFFEDSDGFDTSIVRPGIGYDIAPGTTLWMGYGWIRNDPADTDHFDEHRFWQQLTYGRNIGSASRAFSRTRLEQRFDDRGGETGWRLRQFLRWVQRVAPDARFAFRFWDEAFIDLNDTNWGADTGFRQNRAFAGFGWDLDEERQYTLEFGYMNQWLLNENADDANNHILAVSLLMNR